eukprot:symbB.v1.2.005245.t1/scaffold304.1/size234131/4
MRTLQTLTGTARYASINAHKGMEQSRRDDLQAVAHMLIYFLRGSLPWSGLEAKTQEEKYRKIREVKEKFPIDELCEGHPKEFAKFLKDARSLTYTGRPDYLGLRKMFADLRAEIGPESDSGFEFLKGRDTGELEPVQVDDQIQQPDDKAGAQTGSASHGMAVMFAFTFCHTDSDHKRHNFASLPFFLSDLLGATVGTVISPSDCRRFAGQETPCPFLAS